MQVLSYQQKPLKSRFDKRRERKSSQKENEKKITLEKYRIEGVFEIKISLRILVCDVG